MKFSKRRLIRENLTVTCQKAKHTRIVVLKKRKLSLQRERTEVPRAPLPRLHKSRVKDRPAPCCYLLGITHRAPRTEPGSICPTQSREKWAGMSWNHSRTRRQRGAATREGLTHGSPGVNRFTTLLLLSILGLVCFDPRTDLRSGAIS